MVDGRIFFKGVHTSLSSPIIDDEDSDDADIDVAVDTGAEPCLVLCSDIRAASRSTNP